MVKDVKRSAGQNAKKSSNSNDMENEQVLQAVVLADSFTKTFRPITLDRPKVLLPLVNVPMLEYTLEFLANNSVDEIYVFCSAHSDQVEEYIRTSRWGQSRSPVVRAITVQRTTSAGDALRELDSLGLIRSDPFILLSGDVVANINLAPILEAHNARRANDKNCVMTMVFNRVAAEHRLRPLDDNLVVLMNKDTKQILRYEDDADEKNIRFEDASAVFNEHAQVEARNDLLDCHIDICAPEVLLQMSENYDYADLRKHYVKLEVQNHDLGYRIFAHELVSPTDYAARVHDLRAYDAVSRDLVQRWAYPLVPDNNWCASADSTYSQGRDFVYQETNVTVSRSAKVAENAVVGAGTRIDAGARVAHSVIGRRCIIGEGAVVEHSYLWDDCVIGAGAVVKHAVVCNNASVGKNAILPRGNVVSFGVVVEDGANLKEFGLLTNAAKETESPQEKEQGSTRVWSPDEDSDYDEDDDLEVPSWCASAAGTKLSTKQARGSMGVPELDEMRKTLWSDLGPLGVTNDDDSLMGDADETQAFVRSVRDMIQTGELTVTSADNIALEINGLKFAQNRTFSECLHAMVPVVFEETIKLFRKHVAAEEAGTPKEGDFREVFIATLANAKPLLAKFIVGPVEQLAVIESLELMCEYGEKAARAGLETEDHRDGFPTLPEGVRAEMQNVFPFLLMILFEESILTQESFEIWAEKRANAEGFLLELFSAPLMQTVLESFLEDEESDSDDDDDDEDDESESE